MTAILPEMPIERQTPLDPPTAYHELREDLPIVRMRFPNGQEGWLVTRFDEGSQVFSDPRMSSTLRSRHDIPGEEGVEPAVGLVSFGTTFVEMDAPDHTAYRRLLAGKFSPKAVGLRLQPFIDRIVTEQLDAMAAGPRPVDFVQAMSMPIPCLVICELLGVPARDRHDFHSATDVMMDTSKSKAQRDAGSSWLVDYVTGLVALKRRDPHAEGLLAELIRSSGEEGSIVTDQDLVSVGVLLLFAGHDTTMAMLGLSTLTLLTHPDQRARFVSDPAMVGPAVEELLRYLTIVQFGLSRRATEDLELGGQHITAGELVVVSMAAANRDPRAFANPDVPDLDRKMARHLAFGYGVHQCLGQNVARAELRTVLPRVFEQFPNLRLAVPQDEVPMDVHGTNYGVKKLMVTW
jgi:cytochrome P450